VITRTATTNDGDDNLEGIEFCGILGAEGVDDTPLHHEGDEPPYRSGGSACLTFTTILLFNYSTILLFYLDLRPSYKGKRDDKRHPFHLQVE
jgi:hypothetical protein